MNGLVFVIRSRDAILVLSTFLSFQGLVSFTSSWLILVSCLHYALVIVTWTKPWSDKDWTTI